jgi:hypothetical protein
MLNGQVKKCRRSGKKPYIKLKSMRRGKSCRLGRGDNLPAAGSVEIQHRFGERFSTLEQTSLEAAYGG